MATTTMQDPVLASPIGGFFGYWWANMCLIGCFEAILGLLITYLTRFSPLMMILIVSGVAAAIAGGTAYDSYRYVENASPFEIIDPVPGVFYMLQDILITSYGYCIVLHLTTLPRRKLFFTLGFWTCIVAAIAGRIACIAYYASYRDTRLISTRQQAEHFNIMHLAGLAAAQCWNTAFLLRIYLMNPAPLPDRAEGKKLNLWGRLCHSTEMRNSLLCLVGLSRVAVFAAKSLQGGHWGLAAQMNRFLLNIDVLFALHLMFDFMAVEWLGSHSAAKRSGGMVLTSLGEWIRLTGPHGSETRRSD